MRKLLESKPRFFKPRSSVASVAQLVEQLTLNQLVVGSNPPRGTTLYPLQVQGDFHFKAVVIDA
jgi:hypothetical protein